MRLSAWLPGCCCCEGAAGASSDDAPPGSSPDAARARPAYNTRGAKLCCTIQGSNTAAVFVRLPGGFESHQISVAH